MYSLVIPVYRNEDSIADLLDAVAEASASLDGRLQAVFVVDGSPDRSLERLRAALPDRPFRSLLIVLSRNFGSFAAIRAGLAHADGPYFAVIAADLQEPPELVGEFFRLLRSEQYDIVVGTRSGRKDPFFVRWSSRIFWSFYRRLIQKEMPRGGVDVFGCNLVIRDQLVALGESHTSLVGLLFWLGFRRALVPYERLDRKHGKSAWTLDKKLRYFSDSIFTFSDLPIRLLVFVGALGLLASVCVLIVIIVSKLSGLIDVPGYAATVSIITFFAALNVFGIGILGGYVWRAFENTKGRPESIVFSQSSFGRDNDG